MVRSSESPGREYLIIGASGWCVDPDFRKAYLRWRQHASYQALKYPKELEMGIFQVDTTNLEFDKGKAPVWMDGMGFNVHWTWKKSYADSTLREDREIPYTQIYKGKLSKAPKTNVALEELL